jgi:hypothetical protein
MSVTRLYVAGHRLPRHCPPETHHLCPTTLLVVTAPGRNVQGTSWARLLVVHDGSPRARRLWLRPTWRTKRRSMSACSTRTTRRGPWNRPLRGRHSVGDMLTGSTTATRVSDDAVHPRGVLSRLLSTATDRACDVIILALSWGLKRLVYEHTAEAVLVTTLLYPPNRLATYCY